MKLKVYCSVGWPIGQLVKSTISKTNFATSSSYRKKRIKSDGREDIFLIGLLGHRAMAQAGIKCYKRKGKPVSPVFSRDQKLLYFRIEYAFDRH